MKIQFDSNQDYQLDAIRAVVDLFDGQPLAQGEYEGRFDAVGGDLLSDLGVGNNLVLGEDSFKRFVIGVFTKDIFACIPAIQSEVQSTRFDSS